MSVRSGVSRLALVASLAVSQAGCFLSKEPLFDASDKVAALGSKCLMVRADRTDHFLVDSKPDKIGLLGAYTVRKVNDDYVAESIGAKSPPYTLSFAKLDMPNAFLMQVSAPPQNDPDYNGVVYFIAKYDTDHFTIFAFNDDVGRSAVLKENGIEYTGSDHNESIFSPQLPTKQLLIASANIISADLGQPDAIYRTGCTEEAVATLVARVKRDTNPQAAQGGWGVQIPPGDNPFAHHALSSGGYNLSDVVRGILMGSMALSLATQGTGNSDDIARKNDDNHRIFDKVQRDRERNDYRMTHDGESPLW